MKDKTQVIINENNMMEAYIRGEYYTSTDEAITAYKYNLEGKEATSRELEGMISLLKSEEEDLKKSIKKKQKEYQAEITRKEARSSRHRLPGWCGRA